MTAEVTWGTHGAEMALAQLGQGEKVQVNRGRFGVEGAGSGARCRSK